MFAKEYHHISNEDFRIITNCRKPLLFNENVPWEKKRTENCFGLTMFGYDGAGICELVGI